MHNELPVLYALLRLARSRRSVGGGDVSALHARVAFSHARLRVSLRRLERAGLVERGLGRLGGGIERGPRLTLAGLALAVASLRGRSTATAARKARSQAA